MRITRKKEEQIRGSKIIYDCIGGAIDQLIQFKAVDEGDKDRFINDLLRYTEKIVFLVLRDHGFDEGEICANLMLLREGNTLDLAYFGTFLHGRERLQLIIDPDNLLPGAPEAYYYKKVMYIPNTTSRKYKQYFDENKPYRSIISIPIFNLEKDVFAVLNIDSDRPRQFISKDFINKKILPSITPLISLLQLEKDLFVVG